MGYEKILYSLHDGVARISLNDPATLNASNEVMNAELLDALDRASTEARAIVLTSEGRAFCSGANLANAAKVLDDPRRDVGVGLDRTLGPSVVLMKTMDIPVVSAVRGAAAGVGCGLALSADIIVCGEGGYFFFAFRHVGLVPDGGCSWLLVNAIGRVRAMDVMLRGKKVTGPQALEWGLVTEVVPDDEVEARAMAIARELAQGPRALGFIKKQTWQAFDSSFETALSTERVFQRQACRSDDFAEGVRAFQEKRKPVFTGR
ncbi:enoyl-CoA hydratase-related protein [Novosphingobium sp. KCTC 2891]|uniref:enoyl-CoA hydratase-related protein n=1 Tax=Novosphingobium sp. KCTC 2891 TaxID=2989730 RepID=UPI00222387DA|nr:enoyl-CoA hydratase-related protein [Novosphingobium sp. KCTC 2891]MCW1383673.1 enoyl-CoA hydratase-related protein [Novosphingobium sp. KCTC 2891]